MLSYPPLGRAVYVYGVSVFGALTCSKRRTVRQYGVQHFLLYVPVMEATLCAVPSAPRPWRLRWPQRGRAIAGVTILAAPGPVWPCAAPKLKRPRPSAQPPEPRTRTERDTPHQTEALMERQVHDSQPISRIPPAPRPCPKSAQGSPAGKYARCTIV